MNMKPEQNRQNIKGNFLLFILSVGAIEAALLLLKKNFYENIGNLIIFVILTAVTLFCLQSESKDKRIGVKEGAVYFGLLCLCILSVFLPYLLRPVFFAGMVISCMTTVAGGLAVQNYFILLNVLLAEEPIEVVFYYIIIGSLACIFSDYLKNKKTFPFVLVIMLSVQLTLYAGMKITIEGTYHLKDIGAIIVSDIIAAIGMILFLNLKNRKKDNPLEAVLSPDHELLCRFREYSKEQYLHGQRVSMLAQGMAEKVGADILLSKAGGLYYKIGKIEGKDYIVHGLEIADKYGFPENLTAILKQHPKKNIVPLTIEAAIVMLADTVVSSFEHIYKTHPEISFDKQKVLEQILNSRLEKGYLNQSGMTLHMYYELKNYLMEEGSSL